MNTPIATGFDPSPVSLRYVAALRGLAPAAPGTPFVYVQMGAFDTDALSCLAVSNPEGSFYGFHNDGLLSEKAQDKANRHEIGNLTFGNLRSSLPPKIDFLIYTDPQSSPTDKSFLPLLEEALALLPEGGFLGLHYKTCESEQALFHFLMKALIPEMPLSGSARFFELLETLGREFLAQNPVDRSRFENARTKGDLQSLCDPGRPLDPSSFAFEVMEALLPSGFSFVGDGSIAGNYVDFTVPEEKQDPLLSFKESLFYEPIKDFALRRSTRFDLWVKKPVATTTDAPSLFNAFSFGIPDPGEKIPPRLCLRPGAVFDLQSPLFSALIALMKKLPSGIGDFLSTPAGKPFLPEDVMNAVFLLAAAGLIKPMRGRYEPGATPRKTPEAAAHLSRFFNMLVVANPTIQVASPTVGNGISLSAQEALVLQAISRVGLSLAAGALYEELKRLSQNNPALAATIMDHADPLPEAADSMLQNVLKRDAVRWYAYGLMAA